MDGCKKMSSPRSVRWVLGTISLIMLIAMSSQSRAGVVISATNTTVTAGSPGSFEILLTNTGPSAVNINSFTVDLIAQGSGAAFSTPTDVTTTAAYIFPVSLGFFGTVTGNDITALDTNGSGIIDFPNPAVPVNVGAGSTVGLAHVDFTTSANPLPNSIVLHFTNDSNHLGVNSLSDDNTNPVAFTTADGLITINPSAAVAAPQPVALYGGAACLSLLMGLSIVRRNRRAMVAAEV